MSLPIGYRTFIFSHHLSQEPKPRSQEEYGATGIPGKTGDLRRHFRLENTRKKLILPAYCLPKLYESVLYLKGREFKYGKIHNQIKRDKKGDLCDNWLERASLFVSENKKAVLTAEARVPHTLAGKP